MSVELLDESTWFPKARREVMKRVFQQAAEPARAVLPFALATKAPTAVEFWRELAVTYLPRDSSSALTRPVLEHLIALAGRKTLKPAVIRGAIETLFISSLGPASSADARAKILALGQDEVSLANAHGIYISAARKAKKTSLPKAPPHLDGPVPSLTVLETAELTIELAEQALLKAPNEDGTRLLALARTQLKWKRAGGKGTPPATTAHSVPPTSKSKGPGFALARAALMEACNVDHVSGRGTSIKTGVTHGLALGEAWWLELVDEALMRADARSAFERRGQSTTKPIEHVVFRGGDKSTELWLVRLAGTPKRYALLAKLGRTWTSQEGDLESIAATVPEAWFARAMPIIERRR